MASPEGIAVRTTYETLRGCLPDHVELGVVRYIDYSSAPLPSMNVLEYITHKDTRYSWEQEVRAVAIHALIMRLGPSGSLLSLTDNSEQVVFAPEVNLGSLVQGIVLHPEAKSDFIAEIEQLCGDHGLPTPQRSRV